MRKALDKRDGAAQDCDIAFKYSLDELSRSGKRLAASGFQVGIDRWRLGDTAVYGQSAVFVVVFYVMMLIHG